MPGLVPGIHVFLATSKDVDGRDKPGHDGVDGSESKHWYSNNRRSGAVVQSADLCPDRIQILAGTRRMSPQDDDGSDGSGTPRRPFVVPTVGIGASAGGVQALQAFFEALPDEVGAAFAVVVHLDPEVQ